MTVDHLRMLLREHRDAVYSLLSGCFATGKQFLLRSELADIRRRLARDGGPVAALVGSALEPELERAQEATVHPPWLDLATRPAIGRWRWLRFNAETLGVVEIDASEYLRTRERLATGRDEEDAWPFEIDLGPFAHELPRPRERHGIGRGGEYLNRRLASRLLADGERGLEHLLRFLTLHTCRSYQLMVHPRLDTVDRLRTAVADALEALEQAPGDDDWVAVAGRLQELGFEPGWGRTVDRIRDTLALLQDLVAAPDATSFERFVARIPMVFRVAIISPHGFFGQEGVMGLPDTGGQVVYILDQVRALEQEMRARLYEQGVDFEPEIAILTRLLPEHRGTSCGQRREPVAGTERARILRVPFRSAGGEVVPHWISRFEVWPYLERFAVEAEGELVADLGGRPDLIIGNYSDGNLVATLLSQRLGVTQFAIAHALEKSKYLYSDLYWRHNEPVYHFSCQFSADLVAMNAADCIVTSTFQEIAGSDATVGQYESYGAFTMPGLMRVTGGVDVHDPRFNIVSPGVAPDVYFPADREVDRLRGLEPELERMVFAPGAPDTRGLPEDPERPIILSMARLDRIKNLTGLVEWYGTSDRLRRAATLVVVAGTLDPSRSGDHEERAEVERMHRLMDEHDLDGSMRWIGRLLPRPEAGELYRWVADRRGVFVQPALFEAFGLTVLEAMTSGLPTFATCYGGPLEIIQHGRSGFHLDPTHGDEAAESIADFLERAAADPGVWDEVSRAGIERVEARYTWRLHAERLMTLARMYGFWRYLTGLERAETSRYLQALYTFLYRRRARAMGEGPGR